MGCFKRNGPGGAFDPRAARMADHPDNPPEDGLTQDFEPTIMTHLKFNSSSGM